MANLSLSEQETLIQYDRASDTARIYTHDRRLMGIIERRKIAATAEHHFGGKVVAKSYEVPLDLLSVTLKPKRSAAQRAASREAGKRLSEAKKAKELLRVSDASASPAGSDLFSSGGASH